MGRKAQIVQIVAQIRVVGRQQRIVGGAAFRTSSATAADRVVLHYRVDEERLGQLFRGQISGCKRRRVHHFDELTGSRPRFENDAKLRVENCVENATRGRELAVRTYLIA